MVSLIIFKNFQNNEKMTNFVSFVRFYIYIFEEIFKILIKKIAFSADKEFMGVTKTRNPGPEPFSGPPFFII